MTDRERVFVATPAVLLGKDAVVAAMFGYDADDPWPVTIAFRSGKEWVRWALARELLAAGLLSPVGVGDVTVAPFPTGAVLIELRNARERAEFLFDGAEVARILAASYDLVPLGAERLDWTAEELLFALDDEWRGGPAPGVAA